MHSNETLEVFDFRAAGIRREDNLERGQNLYWKLAGVPLAPWTLKRGYTRVFGYSKAFGSPTRATHGCLSIPRRLEPQMRLRTGVWIPNQGYKQVFAIPTRATHRCLESQPRLHTGVWRPKWAILQVAKLYGMEWRYYRLAEALTDSGPAHKAVMEPNVQ